MQPLLNRRILESPYGDFSEEPFLKESIEQFDYIEAWSLDTDEIAFLKTHNAAAIYQHWGYRTADGAHESFELETNVNANLRHVQTYTDPIMRSLQQYYDWDYEKFFAHEIIGLFDIQKNYKYQNETQQHQITDILNRFFQNQQARKAVIMLSRYRLNNPVSMAFLTLVVSARQLVLLAETYYKKAYKTGKAFLKFLEKFNEKWTPPEESEDISLDAKIPFPLCTICCLAMNSSHQCH